MFQSRRRPLSSCLTRFQTCMAACLHCSRRREAGRASETREG